MRSRIEERVNETELDCWIWIKPILKSINAYLNSWIKWQSTPTLMEENEAQKGGGEKRKTRICVFSNSVSKIDLKR